MNDKENSKNKFKSAFKPMPLHDEMDLWEDHHKEIEDSRGWRILAEVEKILKQNKIVDSERLLNIIDIYKKEIK